MLRPTSPVTVPVREIWPPEPNLLVGRDSAQSTWSKIRATACLNVAAAVLENMKMKRKRIPDGREGRTLNKKFK